MKQPTAVHVLDKSIEGALVAAWLEVRQFVPGHFPERPRQVCHASEGGRPFVRVMELLPEVHALGRAEDLALSGIKTRRIDIGACDDGIDLRIVERADLEFCAFLRFRQARSCGLSSTSNVRQTTTTRRLPWLNASEMRLSHVSHA